MDVRSLFGSLVCFLCGFALMFTYLIRRRCDTLPHCVPTTQPKQPHDKEGWGGGSLSPVSCFNIPKHLPFIPIHFSPCPSSLFRRGSEKESAQPVPVFVCGWSDHLRASCHSLIMVLLAISTERERKRATRSSPEFFRADIYNSKSTLFSECPNATASMWSSLCTFQIWHWDVCSFVPSAGQSTNRVEVGYNKIIWFLRGCFFPPQR